MFAAYTSCPAYGCGPAYISCSVPEWLAAALHTSGYWSAHVGQSLAWIGKELARPERAN